MQSSSSPKPFKLAVQEDVLTDLRRRLALTRWPEVHLLGAEDFYAVLTAHGIDVLLFWIIFFEMAVLYFASAIILNCRLATPWLGWVGFVLLVVGAVGFVFLRMATMVYKSYKSDSHH